MGNYYYEASVLPPLEFSHPTSVSIESLEEDLRLNLSSEDEKKVQVLRLYADISNILLLQREEELDPRGNLGQKELEESLLHREFFPSYVFDFLQEHETREERMRYFPALLSQFFQEESALQTGFLQEFFTFEREWRLVVSAWRAKRMHRDFVKEFQFEDARDPFVAYILAQKDTDKFEPPAEYGELIERLEACRSDPLEEAKTLSKYRFDKAREMEGGSRFSSDYILSYLARLMILEYWGELSERRGKTIVDEMKKNTN